MDRTAGDAVDVEFAAVDGDIGFVDGRNCGANSQEVIGAEAVEFHDAVLDGVCPIAVDYQAVEALGAGGDVNALGLLAGDGSALDQLGHALGLHHLSGGGVHHQGILKVPAPAVDPHEPVGGHGIAVRQGQRNIAHIASGLGIAAHPVDGHADEFACGRSQHRAILNGQSLIPGGGLHQHLTGKYLFHLKSSLL